MTQRTRRFLLGATLILVAGLCTGLVAHYSGNLPFSASAAGPAELSYLPADSMAVAYADVRRVMDSEFRQQLRQVLPSGEEKEKLQAEIGVDLEKDVDSVVVGKAGGPLDDEAGVVVLVRGRFTNSWIESKALEHGAKIDEYRGKRLIVMSESTPDHTGQVRDAQNADRSTGGVAFLEAGLLALGELDSIKRAIDAQADGTNVTKTADVMKLIGDVSAGNHAWVVARVDELAKNASIPDEIRTRIPPVQWFVGSLQVNGGLSGMVRAEALDEQSAEQLRDVVRGGLAAAQLFSGQDARVEAMLKNVQITGTGKSVAVSFTVPSQVIELINGVAGAGRLTAPKATEPKTDSIRK
jgi:hypothetical protein